MICTPSPTSRFSFDSSFHSRMASRSPACAFFISAAWITAASSVLYFSMSLFSRARYSHFCTFQNFPRSSFKSFKILKSFCCFARPMASKRPAILSVFVRMCICSFPVPRAAPQIWPVRQKMPQTDSLPPWAFATFCKGLQPIVEGIASPCGNRGWIFSGHASPSGRFRPVFISLCPPVTLRRTYQPRFAHGFPVWFCKA